VEANGWMRGSLLRAGEFFPRKRLSIFDPKLLKIIELRQSLHL
jgi:hypothetical protein